MTEDDAREAIAARYGAAASDRIEHFLTLVAEENGRQNLIAPSTVGQIWARHALDSAQLVPRGQPGLWIDIGTGGGFPGMVIALLRSDPVMMIEPRRRRAAFLQCCVDQLGMTHARVVADRIERVMETAETISARAVASIENLLHMAAGCAKEETRWLLPRGRLTDLELATLRHHWRGVFHVEQSLTDPASSILILEGVMRR